MVVSRADAENQVRVFVRLRPPLKKDVGYCNMQTRRNQIHLEDTKARVDKWYTFDHIFGGSDSNKQVYERTGRPLVQACMRGYNGTLFAYGQTCSGKTYTLMDQDGIANNIIHDLFRRLNSNNKFEYQVSCSFMQIYKEKIYDLLCSNTQNENGLAIREEKKQGTFVENLTSFICRSPADVEEIMELGRSRWIVEETRMNGFSNRSHVVFQISAERMKNKGERTEMMTRRYQTEKSPLRFNSDSANKYGNVRSKSPLPDSRKMRTPVKTRPRSAIEITDRAKSRISTRKSGSARMSSSVQDLKSRKLFTADDQLVSGTLNNVSSPSPCSVTPDLLLSLNDGGVQNINSKTVDCSSTHEQMKIEDHFNNENDDDVDELFSLNNDIIICGKINIVDLSGSERIKKTHAEGERLLEAQNINLSLLELGNVVSALADGSRTHIPYRNSMLTRLLQDSLGGNCKTSFVLCISPTMQDLNETKCTLDFGQRAMKIATQPRINIEVDYERLSKDLQFQLAGKDARHKEELQGNAKTIENLREQLQEWERNIREKESIICERDRCIVELDVIMEERDLHNKDQLSLNIIKISKLESKIEKLKRSTESMVCRKNSASKEQEECRRLRGLLLAELMSLQLVYSFYDLMMQPLITEKDAESSVDHLMKPNLSDNECERRIGDTKEFANLSSMSEESCYRNDFFRLLSSTCTPVHAVETHSASAQHSCGLLEELVSHQLGTDSGGIQSHHTQLTALSPDDLFTSLKDELVDYKQIVDRELIDAIRHLLPGELAAATKDDEKEKRRLLRELLRYLPTGEVEASASGYEHIMDLLLVHHSILSCSIITSQNSSQKPMSLKASGNSVLDCNASAEISNAFRDQGSPIGSTNSDNLPCSPNRRLQLDLQQSKLPEQNQTCDAFNDGEKVHIDNKKYIPDENSEGPEKAIDCEKEMEATNDKVEDIADDEYIPVKKKGLRRLLSCVPVKSFRQEKQKRKPVSRR